MKFFSSLFAKRKLILDTSIFVNPDVRGSFGDSPEKAINEFLRLAKGSDSMEFYMPTSVLNELFYFVNKEKISDDFYRIIRVKSPDKNQLKCPAILFYELVEEIRTRVNKGLRVAESAVKSVSNKGVDETIKDLRKKYREALREGIIDSKEDVDLIFLSLELRATLITGDQGLIKWADKFGIEWVLPEKFREFLTNSR